MHHSSNKTLHVTSKLAGVSEPKRGVAVKLAYVIVVNSSG